MALLGFARVSSVQQDLTIQVERLSEYGCERVFQGKRSGKADTNKAALDELMAYAREGDTVVVTKLDRFGRSLSQVLVTIESLRDKGVNLVAIDQNIDTANSEPMNTAMIQLLGMFAEMERNFIVSRTQEGKVASGNYGGRKPKLTPSQREEVRQKLSQGVSKMDLSKEYGVSRATIGNIEKGNT
ncbi:recombinase family protein [Ferrimonas futtsuensis]|uniref:recombinase family protein n=1 Tax=Ferrimonas futtsuensis TaxID=364764 RepID=UPI0004894C67|nr:recombinase family protein [Ferrimonas futtsuensis]